MAKRVSYKKFKALSKAIKELDEFCGPPPYYYISDEDDKRFDELYAKVFNERKRLEKKGIKYNLVTKGGYNN